MACATQFRRTAAAERAKLDGPLSIVEKQQIEQAVDLNSKFAAACDVYAEDRTLTAATPIE